MASLTLKSRLTPLPNKCRRSIFGQFPLDCITMSAPLDAIRVLLIGFGRKEPEFGSYAGQLDTGHGAPKSVVHLMEHPAPS
jgi:hypothetical protein